MGPSQHICFETRDVQAAFAALYPHEADSYFALEDWVGLFFDAPATTDRHSAFLELLPPEDHARSADWLYTIEKLRESLVLTHDDADFCFSQLPATPRTEKLLALLHAYLDSELAKDWTAKVWMVRDAIRRGEIRFEDLESLVFLQSSPANLLFPEIATSIKLAGLSCPVSVKYTWQKQTPENSAAVLVQGDSCTLLQRLASRARVLCERGERVILPFLGTAHHLGFLKLCLAHHGLSYRNFFVPLEHRSGNSLGSLAPSLTAQPSSPGTGKEVLIFPLEWLPPTAEFAALAFVDDSLRRPHRPPLLLREGELFLLDAQGFPLPRLVDYQAHAKRALEALQAGRSTPVLFSATNQANVLPLARKSLRVKATPNPAQKNSLRLSQVPPRSFSATQLETFAECPAKYFAQNLLRLRPRASWESEYALRLGQIAHWCLERAVPQKSLTPETLFPEALQEIWPEIQNDAHKRFLLQEQLQRLLGQFAAMERHLAFLFGPTKTLAVEMPFEITLDGDKFSGTLDRLVQLEDGSLLILDYKTGSVDFSPEHILKGEHFQALLYLLAVQKKFREPVAGMLFYDLKEHELRRGLIREEYTRKETKKEFTRGHVLSGEKFGAVLSQGEQFLRTHTQNIKSGEFSARPSATRCGYCDQAAFCRSSAAYA